MYKILWTNTAKKDFQTMCSQFSSYNSKKFKYKLINYISLLELFPYMGRKVPELNRTNIKELIFKKYRIIYKIQNKNIYITQILHSSKQFFISDNTLILDKF